MFNTVANSEISKKAWEWWAECNVSSPSSCITNAHNELYARFVFAICNGVLLWSLNNIRIVGKTKFFNVKVSLYAKKVTMGVATAPTLSLESATAVAHTTVRPLKGHPFMHQIVKPSVHSQNRDKINVA